MEIKKCKTCGKEFKGTTNRKYCCGDCRLERNKEYLRKWRKENREHFNEYQRTYYQENKRFYALRGINKGK